MYRQVVQPELTGAVLTAFEEGAIVHTGEDVPSEEQAMLIGDIPSLRPIVDALIDGDDSAASVAAAV